MTTVAERVARRFMTAGLDTQRRRFEELRAIRDGLLETVSGALPGDMGTAVEGIESLLAAEGTAADDVIAGILDEQLGKLAWMLRKEQEKRLIAWKQKVLPEVARTLKRALPSLRYWAKPGINMHRFYFGGEHDYIYLDLDNKGLIWAFLPKRTKTTRFSGLDEAREILARTPHRVPEVLRTKVPGTR